MSTPIPCGGALVCLACHHWQVDVSNAVRQELGGSKPALWAIAQAHVEHLKECPGEGGRVKVLGQWVERPAMAGGQQAEGVMGFVPFPPWWRQR